jgi:hypothetical protein
MAAFRSIRVAGVEAHRAPRSLNAGGSQRLDPSHPETISKPALIAELTIQIGQIAAELLGGGFEIAAGGGEFPLERI